MHDESRRYFQQMTRIRLFEQRVGELVGSTPSSRFVHLGAGQEAVAVGVCAALEPRDRIALTYRNHAVLLARGADPAGLLAEILGLPSGVCRGRGGSIHALVAELGVVDASGIVGGTLPVAAGSALASTILGEDVVTACFFGDGAVAEGSFHEALNLAALWRLPVLYVCENNHYAMSTPFAATSPVPVVADRAAGYGMQAVRVDGGDVFAVRDAALAAVARCRAGEGPQLLECSTALRLGHCVSYPPGERQRALARDRDPLRRLEPALEPDEVAAARSRAADEVELAERRALAGTGGGRHV